MRKILFTIFIIVTLLLLAGCSVGGKAVSKVGGGPEIQADTYLSRADAQLEYVATKLTEGKLSAAKEALTSAGAYLTNADSAISKIPYNSISRDEFKVRRDAIKQRYDFLKAQIK